MSVSVGEIVEGTVSDIVNYGAFVKLDDGKNGLVHISEVSRDYVQDIHSVLKTGDKIKAKVLSIDDKGKIALSIKKGLLSDKDFQTDNDGLELNRQTIFGDHDLIFKALITNTEGKSLTEEEYFPSMVKAHLDRGAVLLENEKKYSRDFYNHLCRLDSTL